VEEIEEEEVFLADDEVDQNLSGARFTINTRRGGVITENGGGHYRKGGWVDGFPILNR